MKQVVFIILCSSVLNAGSAVSQTVQLNSRILQPIGVSVSNEKLNGVEVVKVVKDTKVTAFDEPTFALVKGSEFKNGIIEVKVFSRLLPNAPGLARGFIGIAFRAKDSTSFECIYIRPTNGRVDNQLRRNRSIQYFSYPDFKFEKLRKEAPGEYESYADMGLNEWIKLKIVVAGSKAMLYLNNNIQPSLIVNDLKHGPAVSGAIGLWVDVGTEGFFSDLKIKNHDY